MKDHPTPLYRPSGEHCKALVSVMTENNHRDIVLSTAGGVSLPYTISPPPRSLARASKKPHGEKSLLASRDPIHLLPLTLLVCPGERTDASECVIGFGKDDQVATVNQITLVTFGQSIEIYPQSRVTHSVRIASTACRTLVDWWRVIYINCS
ncbi:hypothetical protein BC827DRAFT_828160 [Russula dissimulans]|nr:hypothetical protein BC827DRAFT_828160 [Russula dissimulans]